jgi:hypothetical protein
MGNIYLKNSEKLVLKNKLLKLLNKTRLLMICVIIT